MKPLFLLLGTLMLSFGKVRENVSLFDTSTVRSDDNALVGVTSLSSPAYCMEEWGYCEDVPPCEKYDGHAQSFAVYGEPFFSKSHEGRIDYFHKRALFHYEEESFHISVNLLEQELMLLTEDFSELPKKVVAFDFYLFLARLQKEDGALIYMTREHLLDMFDLASDRANLDLLTRLQDLHVLYQKSFQLKQQRQLTWGYYFSLISSQGVTKLSPLPTPWVDLLNTSYCHGGAQILIDILEEVTRDMRQKVDEIVTKIDKVDDLSLCMSAKIGHQKKGQRLFLRKLLSRDEKIALIESNDGLEGIDRELADFLYYKNTYLQGSYVMRHHLAQACILYKRYFKEGYDGGLWSYYCANQHGLYAFFYFKAVYLHNLGCAIGNFVWEIKYKEKLYYLPYNLATSEVLWLCGMICASACVLRGYIDLFKHRSIHKNLKGIYSLRYALDGNICFIGKNKLASFSNSYLSIIEIKKKRARLSPHNLPSIHIQEAVFLRHHPWVGIRGRDKTFMYNYETRDKNYLLYQAHGLSFSSDGKYLLGLYRRNLVLIKFSELRVGKFSVKDLAMMQHEMLGTYLLRTSLYPHFHPTAIKWHQEREVIVTMSREREGEYALYTWLLPKNPLITSIVDGYSGEETIRRCHWRPIQSLIVRFIGPQLLNMCRLPKGEVGGFTISYSTRQIAVSRSPKSMPYIYNITNLNNFSLELSQRYTYDDSAGEAFYSSPLNRIYWPSNGGEIVTTFKIEKNSNKTCVSYFSLFENQQKNILPFYNKLDKILTYNRRPVRVISFRPQDEAAILLYDDHKGETKNLLISTTIVNKTVKSELLFPCLLFLGVSTYGLFVFILPSYGYPTDFVM